MSVTHGEPCVKAVVLTWNDTEMSSRCIASLIEGGYPNLEIILVDNGSQEPCGEALAALFPTIEVVRLATNQGFTGGANAGLKHALSRGADYILFLNNDTVVAPGAVSELVAALEDDPAVGAASALLFIPGPGPRRVAFYTGTVRRDIASHIHFREDSAYDGREWPTAVTEYAPACAMMYRSHALREIGLFDETFGTNWEDYDLCLRFSDHGWTMLTVGTAHVDHLHGATTGRTSPYIVYYATRNRLICLFRYGSAWGILRNSPHIARTFMWQIRGYGLSNWRCHWAFAKGVAAFGLAIRGEAGAPAVRAAD
ncbi:MAG: glycosyltransferase family 2 protein [Nannocystaceae bacterium]